jgi:hypothetical protein
MKGHVSGNNLYLASIFSWKYVVKNKAKKAAIGQMASVSDLPSSLCTTPLPCFDSFLLTDKDQNLHILRILENMNTGTQILDDLGIN